MLRLRYKRPLHDFGTEPWLLTIPTNQYEGSCDIRIDWGDGTSENINDIQHLTHQIRGEVSDFIVSIDGEIASLHFGSIYHEEKSQDWLYEVSGELPTVNTLVGLFDGCANLSRVRDHSFLQQNTHHEDITRMFANCRSYIPNWFIWKDLPNVRIARYLHINNQSIYEIPVDFGTSWEHLQYIDYMFSMNGGLMHVSPDLFRYNTELRSADYCFSYCHNLRHIGILFEHNPELISARFLFCGDENLYPVDPNYRSYFLHPDVNLEGIFRDTRVDVFLFENEK